MFFMAKKRGKLEFCEEVGREKCCNKLVVFIASFLIVFIVAFLGSLFTSFGTKTPWYDSIKPEITPPDYVFPIAWTILFFLIALSLFFSWVNSLKKEKKSIFFLYGANFILNVLWSVFYFCLQNPILAFIDIILLLVSIILLLSFNWKIDRKAAWLLVPYLLWVAFASILNLLSI